MKTKKGLAKIGYLFKETFSECIDDNVLKLSAALSYYTIFSLPPLFIILTSLSGIFYKQQAIQGKLYGQMQEFVGARAALQIEEIIKSVSIFPHNVFAAVLGLIILVIGASGIFSEIQASINYIWGIKSKPKHGLIRFAINRLMSFFMIATAGFLLLMGLFISSLADMLSKRIMADHPPETIYLYHIFNFLLLFILITFLFLAIFKSLLDGKVAFLDSLLGASFTAILFMGGKYLIGAYLGNSSLGSVYGAAGSVILILAWIYYSAIILYFGTEFTKVYSKIYGKKIVPNNHTFLITKPERNL